MSPKSDLHNTSSRSKMYYGSKWEQNISNYLISYKLLNQIFYIIKSQKSLNIKEIRIGIRSGSLQKKLQRVDIHYYICFCLILYQSVKTEERSVYV